ncbi:hypothetical protein [Spirosoma radiotolerans]|nr:hypothetical protein [Spirosoma radiotolerans]
MYQPVAKVDTKRKAFILVIKDNPDQWFISQWALLQRFPEV